LNVSNSTQPSPQTSEYFVYRCNETLPRIKITLFHVTYRISRLETVTLYIWNISSLRRYVIHTRLAIFINSKLTTLLYNTRNHTSPWEYLLIEEVFCNTRSSMEIIKICLSIGSQRH